MIRVLIADDEVLVRLGLRAAIDWEAHGFSIVGEVGNGRDALERVRAGKVDILLLDIKMPQLNGLDVLKAIRAENLAVKVVVLSCHDDFEYVKEAMRLGAVDYLLKLSLQTDQLLQTLRRIEHPTDLQKHETASTQLLSLLYHYDESVFDQLCQNGCNLKKEHCIVLLAQREPGETVDDKYVLSVLHDTISRYSKGECLSLGNGLFAAVLNIPFNQLERLTGAMIESAEKYTHCQLFIGAASADTLEELPRAMQEAQLALEARYVLGPGRANLTGCQKKWNTLSLEEQEIIAFSLRSNVAEGFDQLLATLEQEALTPPYPTIQNLREHALEWLTLYRDTAQEYDLHLETLEKPSQVVEQLSSLADLIMFLRNQWSICSKSISEKKYRLPQRDEIIQALEYIQNHYTQDINLAELSRYVGLSKNHFSSLFKRETGEGLNEFITRLRLEYSSKLLETTLLTVSEIAEKAGFSSIYYFSSVFKKKYKIGPTEYRMQHSRRKNS